jgi:hypothetical protein
MSNFALGRIGGIDDVARVVMLGPVRFRVRSDLPLQELSVGRRIAATYEVHDGALWITQFRVEPEPPPQPSPGDR